MDQGDHGKAKSGGLGEGDSQAIRSFNDKVYEELRRIAGSLMAKERANHTLQPTALVNELWIRFYNILQQFDDRRHFMHAAALAMRRILIDHARRRQRQQPGKRVPLDDLADPMMEEYHDASIFDEALVLLEQKYPKYCRVFMYRYFAGCNDEEIGRLLELESTSVPVYFRTARAIIERHIRGDLG